MIPDLDAALYTDDLLERDAARRRLSQVGAPLVLAALIDLLDAPHKVTRRRAARILGDTRPAKAEPVLSAALLDATRPLRIRVTTARILTSICPNGSAGLGNGLVDAEPRVRRACATAAAPTDALVATLTDPDPAIADRAVAALKTQGQLPNADVLAAAVDVHGINAPALVRALAAANPRHPSLIEAALTGDASVLDHLGDPETLHQLLEGPHRVGVAWALSRVGEPDPAWVTHSDWQLRAALARGLAPDDPLLAALANDADPAVAWMARHTQAGAFRPKTLAARLERHARLDAPSAQPPYGIQEDDPRPEVPRVNAALALCQPRFDINLGTAVRSAEAAGFKEVFLVGNAGLFRSPARGTDRVLPIHAVADGAALVRKAREMGYQIVGVQQTPDSVPYHQADYPPRPLFVMGAEDRGMPAALRTAADLLVEIPQFGLIDSINLAAAATVVMFHWRCHHG